MEGAITQCLSAIGLTWSALRYFENTEKFKDEQNFYKACNDMNAAYEDCKLQLLRLKRPLRTELKHRVKNSQVFVSNLNKRTDLLEGDKLLFQLTVILEAAACYLHDTVLKMQAARLDAKPWQALQKAVTLTSDGLALGIQRELDIAESGLALYNEFMDALARFGKKKQKAKRKR